MSRAPARPLPVVAASIRLVSRKVSAPVAEIPTTVESTPATEESKTDSGASSNDWPDFSDSDGEPAPDKATQEGNAAEGSASSNPDGPKRKRRRKKGKGNGAQNPSAAGDGEGPSEAPENRGDSAPAPAGPRPNQGPRPKLDSELLAKFAWKIYLAEISEEGVAPVGDNDARELGRRCFRLPEISLEEQARRR